MSNSDIGLASRAEVYQDEADEWRWRARARNGQIIATSGEGYVDEGHARRMASALFPGATVITMVEGD